jgi:hypothetical protein
MAKDQPAPLEPLEEETVYFIEQCQEYPYNGQWVIYSNTKYGKKMFMNYYSKESAESAANVHGLTLLCK